MSAKRILIIACIQSLLMAIYHFILPIQFNWIQFLPKESPTIAWATIALNNYFSFNLLVLSCVFLVALNRSVLNKQANLYLAWALLLFWVFSAFYQMVQPMPLPQNLFFLKIVLPGLAWVNSIIILIGIRKLLRQWS